MTGQAFSLSEPSFWSFFLSVRFFLSCVGCTQSSKDCAEEWSIFISGVIRREDIWDVTCCHMTLRSILLGLSYWFRERIEMPGPIITEWVRQTDLLVNGTCHSYRDSWPPCTQRPVRIQDAGCDWTCIFSEVVLSGFEHSTPTVKEAV